MGWTMPDGAVLGIFAKRPDVGSVKTRLGAELGSEFSAEVSEAMTLDLADLWGGDRILAPGGRRVLVFSPDDAGPWFDPRVPDSLALQPQEPGDLGHRMRSFFEEEFAEGATRVVLIGSDSPTLDPSIVVSAFLCLEGRDVVLGPSTDGGFYLIGCRNLAPPIFDMIDWSTPRVLEQTVVAVRTARRTLGLLPPWYDIDTAQDWQVLRGHLLAMRTAGIDSWTPRLEAMLEQTGS